MEIDGHKNKAQSRLIGVSVALLFLYYADAKIDGASLGGTKIEFRNEGAIVEFLWATWLYYYVRAYQYFKDFGQIEYRDSLDKVVLHGFGPKLLRVDSEDFDLLSPHDPLRSSLIRARVLLFPRSYLINNVPRRAGTNAKRTITAWHFRRKRFNLLRGRKRGLWTVFGRVRIEQADYVLGVQLTVFPTAAKQESQGRNKEYVYFGPEAIWWLTGHLAKSVVLRTGFAENYGPLLIGLLPVWYFILFR